MQESLMQQGVELMLYGMGTVFVFLTLLVILTTAMSALLSRFVKPELAVARRSAGPDAGAAVATDDKQLIAAISAAIHKHRSRHK